MKQPDSHATPGHEQTDADARSITQFGIALTFVVILAQLLLWWLFSTFSHREQKLSPPVPAIIRTQLPKEPPEPRLQDNPQLDMRKMLMEEDDILKHYAWVDPDRGIVRLPIERAMDIVARKGMPQFKAAEQPSASSGKAKASK